MRPEGGARDRTAGAVEAESELQARLVAVRHRTEGDKGQVTAAEFAARCVEQVRSRAL